MVGSLSRRQFLGAAIGALGASAMANRAKGAGARPNVLLILADDMGFWMPDATAARSTPRTWTDSLVGACGTPSTTPRAGVGPAVPPS